MKKTLRINLFTKRSLQFRYLLIIIIAMVVPATVVGSALYYFIFTMTADQIAIPEAIAQHLVPVLNKMNVILLSSLLPIFSLLLLWGLVLSNRFCGPLKRIETDLDKILAGDDSVRLNVRKNDDIRDVIDKLNMVLDKLRGKKQ